MYVDLQEQFSNAQSVASAVGDVVSTNVYDTGAAQDVGIGEPLHIFATLTTALAGAGSIIQAVVQTSADNSTWVDADIGQAFPLAVALVNTPIARINLNCGYRRYIRMAYRISGATASGGAVTSYMVKDLQAQQIGASGFTVA